MNQVQKYIFFYLNRKIPAGKLLDWLSDAVSPMVSLGLTSEELDLALDVELRAAEFTGGFISESQFRSLLYSFIDSPIFEEVPYDSPNEPFLRVEASPATREQLLETSVS